jgi:steroid delta-isomerase-like uncharacterized protein
MTTIEQNKDIVREFIDRVFTKGDLSAIDELLTEDFVNHDPHFGAPEGREAFRYMGRVVREACPDWHSDLHVLIGEGDLVAEQFTASGTQRGELAGVAPTGREVSMPGINIFRIAADGRIAERWGRLDELGLLRQLGAVDA